MSRFYLNYKSLFTDDETLVNQKDRRQKTNCLPAVYGYGSNNSVFICKYPTAAAPCFTYLHQLRRLSYNRYKIRGFFF